MLVIHEALACPAGRAAAEDRPRAAWAGQAAFAPPPIATAYGTLLNHRDALAALGEAVENVEAALDGARELTGDLSFEGAPSAPDAPFAW